MAPEHSFPKLDTDALFTRLAEGGAAGITVVTPNRRLAQELEHDFDRHQLARGLVSWDAADILPLSAFLGRLYEDALYSELAADLPLLLSAEEEQALWERVVGDSREGEGLLARVQAAAACREAWRTAHAFGFAGSIAGFAENEDTRAFLAWSRAIEHECARNGWTDAARLPALVSSHLANSVLKRPSCLVLHAFDLLSPQQRNFVDALEATGVEVFESAPVRSGGRAMRLSFPTGKDEILAAARWARARLEQSPDPGTARIAIVVPDLQKQRKAIRRLFAAVLSPGPDSVPPFNISLGEPLSGFPIVHAALLLLEAASGARIEFARLSLLLRSPFIAGGEEEQAARARLEARLRERSPATLSLGRLARLVAEDFGPIAPGATHMLGRLAAHAREHLGGQGSPADWGRRIDTLLKLAGFPGRAPYSAEYQALKKFHELISVLGAIERVLPRMRFRDAVSRLRRMAADTLFQPEANDEPIQVLGVLESAGLAFDHLWVMGLTDEAWPLHARPSPFLPVELQRRAGVPEASATASLALDRRITEGWLAAAPEVLFSHPLRDGERELSVSPLIVREPIEALDFAELDVPEYPLARDRQFEAGRQGSNGRGAYERIAEPPAPAWAPGEPLTGGTGVFRDQAACPFRAFAAHRLGARALESVEAGLSAADRGTLMHGVLSRAWAALRDQAGLKAAIAGGGLDVLLAESAKAAIERVKRFRPDALEGRFAELEAARLARAAREWLETVDATRPPFAVEAVEAKRAIEHGGVSVQARLDRMDRLEDGARLVIDYKTGVSSVSGWLGERPEEPQLPIYALAEEGVAAVAFAQVRPGAMKLDGIGAHEEIAPGIGLVEARKNAGAKAYANWDELVAGWEHELDALGRAFARGDATVDPKRGGPTCTHCGLQALCRVNERAAWGPTEGEEASE